MQDEWFILVEVNKLIDIEGIGPVYAEKLKLAGAETTKDLLKLAKTPADRKKLAESTGIGEELILKWANHADLMRIKGIGGEFAELLEKVGVDTVKELKNRNAENLYETVEKFDITADPIIRRKPSKNSIHAWIRQAKRLKPTLTY
jgi:predicted flap endonuclease-1-like 5' DNA nuclease